MEESKLLLEVSNLLLKLLFHLQSTILYKVIESVRSSDQEDEEWKGIYKWRNFITLKLRIWIFLMYFLSVTHTWYSNTWLKVRTKTHSLMSIWSKIYLLVHIYIYNRYSKNNILNYQTKTHLAKANINYLYFWHIVCLANISTQWGIIIEILRSKN